MSKNQQPKHYYGEVFRLFRKSKGINIKEASHSIVSSGLLSDFENGKSMLAGDKLFALLKNINVTSLEFQNAYDNYMQIDDVILFGSTISEAHLTKNSAKFKNYISKFEKSIEEFPENNKLKIDKSYLEAALSLTDPAYTLPYEDALYIRTYLSKIKEWGFYEISLLGHSVYVLDIFTLYDLTTKMLQPTELNYNIHLVQKAKLQTLLNALWVFIIYNQFNFAKNIITQLERENILEYDLYEKLTFIYSKAMLTYRQMRDVDALSQAKKCQEFFNFCECYLSANTLEKEIDNFT